MSSDEKSKWCPLVDVTRTCKDSNLLIFKLPQSKILSKCF